MSEVNPEGRKRNILISLLYYYPHRTGLTKHVQMVAEELARRGHDVTVLTARYNDSLPRDSVMHRGVRVIRLWSPLHMSRGMIMPAFPHAAYRLMRKADIVAIHTPMLETALISLLAGIAGVKVLPTHHGDLVLPPTLTNRFIRLAMFLLYKWMAKRAPAIIAYSEDYADHSYYLKPFREKVIANYPPIQIPEPQAEQVAALRAQWQKGDGPIIGYSGRFVQEKRPDLAIRAMDVVRQQYPDAQLVFAGEYEIAYEDTWQREQALVQSHADHLHFLGLLTDNQALANFYAACDVLVLPSDTECFALVQVEAMLCGTPVVMTNIPGGRVPVSVTGMGKLAEAGDWQSIGQALVEVLNDLPHYTLDQAENEVTFSFVPTGELYVDTYLKHAR
ncbi:glycosyltransferase family 4 protein [Anaerolineales bacterium]